MAVSLHLQAISTEIRSATTSMTSVPKPLKFLMKHYDTIKTFYESSPPSDNKPKLADVISILAISSGKKGERESLKYRLQGSQVQSQLGTNSRALMGLAAMSLCS